MNTQHTGIEAKVTHIPACDLCREIGDSVEAKYDAKSRFGPWGYMCQYHFEEFGIGLGLGKGQRLVASSAPASSKE